MNRSSALSTVFLPALALAFAVGYTQLPLYSWDQNTYFLHGLARAGYGFLASDPLVRTGDTVPAFSALVTFTYRVLGERFFYLYQIVILAAYFYALVDIARSVTGVARDTSAFFAFAAILTAAHSSLARAVSVALFTVDIFAPFTMGMASHAVVGLVFQPSVFSVLLILSVALFLRRKAFLAVLALAFSATMHPVYLLSGAALTSAYMAVLYREKRSVREPLLVGVLALGLVLPITLYAVRTFSPTSGEITHRALDILVNFRIPHHAVPRVWFGVESVVQLLLMVGALVAVRRTRLFPVLLVAFLIGVVLTIVQVATGNLRLALISPWRISVVLIPISTACVLARIVEKSARLLLRHRRAADLASGLLIAAVLLGGIASTRRKFALRANDPARPMMEYVGRTKTPDALYLVPTDMANFRLATGAPIFVDFKSHPFKDVEVIEWYDRLERALRFYAADSLDWAVVKRFASDYGVTRVVAPAGLPARRCAAWELRYRDSAYRVYAIRRRARD